MIFYHICNNKNKTLLCFVENTLSIAFSCLTYAMYINVWHLKVRVWSYRVNVNSGRHLMFCVITARLLIKHGSMYAQENIYNTVFLLLRRNAFEA